MWRGAGRCLGRRLEGIKSVLLPFTRGLGTCVLGLLGLDVEVFPLRLLAPVIRGVGGEPGFNPVIPSAYLRWETRQRVAVALTTRYCIHCIHGE